MSKVKLNINIPQSLSDITLGQYQEYLKVVDINKDDEEAGDFLNLKALEIFCGLALKESYNLPVKHFHFALQHLEACFKEQTPLIHRFTFRDPNGVEQEMGFIPKLDDMTYGEYVDATKYVADWQKMHLAMAVLYRPVRIKHKESYAIEEYNGTDTYGWAMKEMPVSIAIGALLFFYRLAKKLMLSIPLYLQKHQEQLKMSNDDLQKFGDGIQASLLSLEETYLGSTMQQKFLYTKQ